MKIKVEFWKKIIGFLLLKTLEDNLLIKWVEVQIDSPKHDIGTFFWNNNA